MSFPKYSAYKDSGVEWLGEVPAHWSITPLKFSASCNDTVLPESTDDDYEIEYVEISDVNEVSGITGSASYKFSDAPSRARRMLQDGDVLISTVRTYLRAIAPVVNPPENLIASTGFAVVRPRKGILDGAFLGYLLRAEWWISEVIARSVGVSYPAINASDLIGLNIPVPALQEQTQIARFLDHETARIDALIEEQQRLIELLKEKRQAVISHAVTKGLDPTVQMKYSGVEWLGEVPAHWALRPLKYQCRFSGGGTPSKDNLEYWNGDIPWVSPKDMKRFWLSDTEDKITELAIQESSANLVKSGALLMVVRSGILQRTIPVAINTVPVTLNQDMKALIFDGERTAEFVAFFISGFERPILQAWRKQGATVESIEHEYVANTMIPIPPKEELVGIVNAMRAVEVKFDSLSSESACLIRKLQERRSALISAAVTGKIDVRNWQPPAEQYPVGDAQNRTEPEVV